MTVYQRVRNYVKDYAKNNGLKQAFIAQQMEFLRQHLLRQAQRLRKEREKMKIIIEATPKEIADFVLGLQNQLLEEYRPINYNSSSSGKSKA